MKGNCSFKAVVISLSAVAGTRDPYKLDDAGAGFVLCWQGNPEIRIGHENHQRELLQVMSNKMLIAVPK
jgi:hypothetical protein